MITPPLAEPPRIGLLRSPSEDELVAAAELLADEALTLSWAAEYLGLGVARAAALARAGDLLAIPGPWPLRQAHRSGLGYFVPGWQFSGSRAVHPALPDVVGAAAAADWTGLDLHRFMTAPSPGTGETPAQLLARGESERVVSLIRNAGDPAAAAPAPGRRRRRLRAPRRPHPQRRRRRIAA
ncbi:MAG TPA: hypothetical protein VF186_06905 [Gaiellaceae bacterium]